MHEFLFAAYASGAAERFVLRVMYLFVGVLFVFVGIPAIVSAIAAVPLWVYLVAPVTAVRGALGLRPSRWVRPVAREGAARR